MRVLICGDRNWTDRAKIEKKLRELQRYRSLVICSGGARGVDSTVREICVMQGIPFFECPAPWSRFRKKAGPIRNGWMLKYFQPKLVLAFHSNIDESRGTADMLKKARMKKIPTCLIQ